MRYLHLKNIIILLLFFIFVSISYSIYSRIPDKQSFIQELEKYALPAGPVRDSDIPDIQNKIQQVLDIVTKYYMYQQDDSKLKRNKSDSQPLMKSMLFLQHWLDKQECVERTVYPLARASEKHAGKILTSLPAKIKISIFFKCRNEQLKKYNLLVSVNSPGRSQYAQLREIH